MALVSNVRCRSPYEYEQEQQPIAIKSRRLCSDSVSTQKVSIATSMPMSARRVCSGSVSNAKASIATSMPMSARRVCSDSVSSAQVSIATSMPMSARRVCSDSVSRAKVSIATSMPISEPNQKVVQALHSSKLSPKRIEADETLSKQQVPQEGKLIPSVAPSAAPTRTSLQVSDLDLGNQAFDPTEASLKTMILETLRLDASAAVESKRRIGGCNEGIWFVSSPGHDLILKLVKSSALFSDEPSEAECYRRLCQKHPSILNDVSLGFPHHVFRVMKNSSHEYDLIVMRKVPGQMLSDWMQEKWRKGMKKDVLVCLEKVGQTLSEFHRRYGVQHGDMQPMNVIYDEVNNAVSFIDLGAMGGVNGSFAMESDVDHFCKAVALMAKCVGEDLKEGLNNFKCGHQRSPSAGICKPQPSSQAACRGVSGALPTYPGASMPRGLAKTAYRQ